MKKEIFAVKMRGTTEVERVELGNAVMYENRISAYKYDQLKRKSFKAFPELCNNEYVKIITSDGKVADFGGYPATGAKAFIAFM